MSSVQATEGQEKQSSTSCSLSVGRIQMGTSYVVDSDMEKRATSTAEKETTYETSYDVSRKGIVPLTRSMFDHSVQTLYCCSVPADAREFAQHYQDYEDF